MIFHEDKLTFFIGIGNLSYLKPFQKENFLNSKNGKMDAKLYLSQDKKHLIIEKKIHINDRRSTSKFIGKGKKIISISENSNNLIKALSIGWRYGKMLNEGRTIREIGTDEHKADRNHLQVSEP